MDEAMERTFTECVDYIVDRLESADGDGGSKNIEPQKAIEPRRTTIPMNFSTAKHIRVSMTFAKIIETHYKKNKDYSSSFPLENFFNSDEIGISPDFSVLARIGEKISRLGSIPKKRMFYEGVAETALDLAIHSIIYKEIVMFGKVTDFHEEHKNFVGLVRELYNEYADEAKVHFRKSSFAAKKEIYEIWDHLTRPVEMSKIDKIILNAIKVHIYNDDEFKKKR